MIFQEPMTSLKIAAHGRAADRRDLEDPPGHGRERSHASERWNCLQHRHPRMAEKRSVPFRTKLSGGQRQRAWMIAMSAPNQPELLIADEPTTALGP